MQLFQGPVLNNRKIYWNLSAIYHIIYSQNGEPSAKVTKGRSAAKMSKKSIDNVFQGRGRGRPSKLPASEVIGRADHYRNILKEVWDKVWPALSKAETKDDVIAAIELAASIERRDFTGHASLLLEILKDKKFPKRQQTRINYLADSLAAWGKVTPRRSRDICAKERAKARRANHIIRHEFYVECSCGYEGPARNNACLKCGAPIPQPSLGDVSRSLNALQCEKF